MNPRVHTPGDASPWTSPSGENGFQPGELVPGDQLPAILEDAANWEYPEDGNWIGALTLVETEAERRSLVFLPRRWPSRPSWREGSLRPGANRRPPQRRPFSPTTIVIPCTAHTAFHLGG
jgi:hypothetical protein